MAGTQKDFGEMELAEILKECLRQCKSLLKSPGLQNPIEWRSLQDPRCILAESLCGSAAAPTEIPSVHKTKRWRWQGEMDSRERQRSPCPQIRRVFLMLNLVDHSGPSSKTLQSSSFIFLCYSSSTSPLVSPRAFPSLLMPYKSHPPSLFFYTFFLVNLLSPEFSSHSVWMILHPALQALKLPPHADSHSPGWDPLAICSEKGRKGRNSPTTFVAAAR
ncbi:PREDICTED: uncharacterized protein LOC102011853 isoform X2 [Chinchilla lanigera]|uniref:uncharacterized protein LOC102011853 isoform X2 n=1 Tax=Chinchilla lanigera TaxID=34839 RepID=UPI00038EDD28|nr:PREDICTED: uncharacterized protein LOC102011853 isoform X2 [Chinchilla lanigera]